MKPPPFAFQEPTTVDEVLELLAEHRDDARILAGGQSLIPLLNFRLVQPDLLIDVNRVSALAYIEDRGDAVTIGAMTRQARIERSACIAERWPLLREALSYVAHEPIRNRGTLGGSLAHADPAAELPVVMVTSEATLVARNREWERRISADDFFVSHLTTALEDDELLVSVEIPMPPPGTGAAFAEYARRNGDYAVGGAGALVTLDPGGVCVRARIGLLGAADVPVRAPDAEAVLIGRRLDAELIEEASGAAVGGHEPIGADDDARSYRRSVIASMCGRALKSANARAMEMVR